MSSWFGGPATSSHKHHSHSNNGGAYVRSSGKRSPSPRRQFVRSHSPAAQSTRSFSSMFGAKHNSSSSYYKRRPRDGFISRIIRQIKRYLRDLIEYARGNPLKVMMLVLPLITGGALATVVKSLGVSLPFGLSSLIGGGSRGRGFDGISGGRGQGLGLDQVVNIAKMFI